MKPTRLPPALRVTFMIVGPLLIVASLVGFVAAGMIPITRGTFPNPIILVAVMALLPIGGILANLGWMRPMAEITATETEGAVEHVARSARRGWGAAVRIRCRACGALETEDAKFCSQCGQTV